MPGEIPFQVAGTASGRDASATRALEPLLRSHIATPMSLTPGRDTVAPLPFLVVTLYARSEAFGELRSRRSSFECPS